MASPYADAVFKDGLDGFVIPNRYALAEAGNAEGAGNISGIDEGIGRIKVRGSSAGVAGDFGGDSECLLADGPAGEGGSLIVREGDVQGSAFSVVNSDSRCILQFPNIFGIKREARERQSGRGRVLVEFAPRREHSCSSPACFGTGFPCVEKSHRRAPLGETPRAGESDDATTDNDHVLKSLADAGL